MTFNFRAIEEGVIEKELILEKKMKEICFDISKEIEISKYSDIYHQNDRFGLFYSKIAIKELLPEELGGNNDKNQNIETNYEEFQTEEENNSVLGVTEMQSEDEPDHSIIENNEPTF